MKEAKEIDWQVYWDNLLETKKVKGKVLEMNQTDDGLGNTMKIEEICHQIFMDYPDWCNNLEEIKHSFLKVIDSIQGVHLQCSRIKKRESLLVKVITKRHENLKNKHSDYSRICGENYKEIITDLIGMRLIINYRGKWSDIHEALIREFPYAENRDMYKQNKLLPHPSDRDTLQVEIPKVYYATGDDVEEYREYGLDVRLHEKGYRSIHYTVSYFGVYIEIQVRTIYDEAWSDCDHSYVYKQDENKSHTALEKISSILCKLTNLSNDVGDSMKKIFDTESFVDLGNNRWKTSQESVKLFDEALVRMQEVYDIMQDFRDKLEVDSKS